MWHYKAPINPVDWSKVTDINVQAAFRTIHDTLAHHQSWILLDPAHQCVEHLIKASQFFEAAYQVPPEWKPK